MKLHAVRVDASPHMHMEHQETIHSFLNQKPMGIP